MRIFSNIGALEAFHRRFLDQLKTSVNTVEVRELVFYMICGLWVELPEKSSCDHPSPPPPHTHLPQVVLFFCKFLEIQLPRSSVKDQTVTYFLDQLKTSINTFEVREPV